MTCILLDEMRWAELGRSEAESVAGGGEELVTVSDCHLELTDTVEFRTRLSRAT
jgi:hypothetical protein